MKAIIFVLVLTFGINKSHSSPALNSVINKLDHKIRSLEEKKSAEPASMANNDAILMAFDEKEAQLWGSILDAHRFLKQETSSDINLFLQEAVMAASLGHPHRIPALEKWLQREHSRVSFLQLKDSSYNRWKEAMQKIRTAINALERSGSEATSPDKTIEQEYYLSLVNLRQELKGIINTKAPVKARTSFFEELVASIRMPQLSNSDFAVGAVILSFIPLAFLIFRKKRIEQVPTPEVHAEVAPEKADLDTTREEFATEESGLIHNPSHSLEDMCRKVLEENTHLLEIAQIKLFPVARSPFRTGVKAPVENVNEALNWLLKGTLALANTSGSRISHMEWNCHENKGRVSVDFVLHGLACDSTSVFLNTLVDGEGSAPANFGRTESALEGFYPTVAFRSDKKKTIISLGLDADSKSMNH